MALRFIDGFDHYVTADMLLKWTAAGAIAPTIASGGRRSGQALRISSATASSLSKTIDAQATWIIGFALNAAALPTVDRPILALVETATLHVDVRVKPDGTFIVTRNGTTLGTSTATLTAGSYSYIEFKCTIDNSAGAFELRLNGTNILSASSQDTQNGGTATANVIRLGYAAGITSSSNWDYDDLYVCDSTGSDNNDFLGDCRVDTYMPSGAGNTTNLTPSAGSNYQCVDESLQNGDTDYVQSSTATDKDTYAVTDMTHTPTDIYGVQVNLVSKKDDAGARSIAAVTRSGGADYDGATQALSTSYVVYLEVVEQDPNTSAAWTKTNLNAAEFGVKIAA